MTSKILQKIRSVNLGQVRSSESSRNALHTQKSIPLSTNPDRQFEPQTQLNCSRVLPKTPQNFKYIYNTGIYSRATTTASKNSELQTAINLVSTLNFNFFFLNSFSQRYQKTERKMCLVFVCDQDERVVGRQPAPGVCPYCGGLIQAMDVETQWRFCFLPLYFRTKRKFSCTVCARHLVVQ